MAHTLADMLVDDDTSPAAWRLLNFMLTPIPLEHLSQDPQPLSRAQLHHAELIRDLDTHLSVLQTHIPQRTARTPRS